jgi:hypothetical protein
MSWQLAWHRVLRRSVFLAASALIPGTSGSVDVAGRE